MEENEFWDIIIELQARGFINCDRIILASKDARYHGIASRLSRIEYDPQVLKFFSRNQICFILLHEEYHCKTIIGDIPKISEPYAMNYAREKITIFDPTIVPDDIQKSVSKNLKEYRKTFPPLNILQKIFLPFKYVDFSRK